MILLELALGCATIYYYHKSKRCSYTKLLNKAQFNKDMKKLRRDNDVIVLIDIDKFKDINDTHGHKFGDKVIEDVAKCIRSNIRMSDRAYRIGGDEFAIITSNASVANRIKDKLSVSVSVGCGKTYEEADANMYSVKE